MSEALVTILGQWRFQGWDEFALADAPHMDIIVTVCDNAAGETCPLWPGHPVTAPWDYEDPHGATEEEARAAFGKVFGQIRKRIEAFVALPLDRMDMEAVRAAVRAIGAMPV